MSQTFTNREVMGSFETAITLQNISDDSSAPVYGLGLEFSTEPGITIERVREEYLEILGPPVFKWFFGNVPEEPIQNVYGSEASIVPGSSFRAPFTPGFDASISMDKTNFSEPAAQVFTLTIVPRQNFITDFIFHLDGGAYGDAADVVITSLEPGEHIGPAGERITVTLDRKNIAVDTLSLTINEAYSFTMTLQVDPRQPNTTYKPFTAIAWILPGGSDRGTTLGNMLTVQVDKVGIWTWTAIGEYLWEWQGPGTQYGVDFN